MKTRRPLKRSAPPKRKAPMKRSPIKRRPPGVLPLQTREAVKERARGRCERCGVPNHLRGCAVHHKRLRSAGGADELPNLAYLCTSANGKQGCHEWAHANPAQAVKEGWIIQRKPAP